MAKPRRGFPLAKYANKLVVLLSNLGVPLGPIRVLTLPGRTSGKPRSTPIGTLTVGGRRYVVAGIPTAGWAQNARAAGRGRLAQGRRREAVTLTEVADPAVRRRVMAAFPTALPRGVPMFQRLGLVNTDNPAEFAAVSDQVAIFAIDPVAKP